MTTKTNNIIQTTVVTKGEETYIFMFSPNKTREIIKEGLKMVKDNQLSFDYQDLTMLAKAAFTH